MVRVWARWAGLQLRGRGLLLPCPIPHSQVLRGLVPPLGLTKGLSNHQPTGSSRTPELKLGQKGAAARPAIPAQDRASHRARSWAEGPGVHTHHHVLTDPLDTQLPLKEVQAACPSCGMGTRVQTSPGKAAFLAQVLFIKTSTVCQVMRCGILSYF